ncbi:MAG: hypothetical protein R2706_15400 [Acidimicrobiales bacterium]
MSLLASPARTPEARLISADHEVARSTSWLGANPELGIRRIGEIVRWHTVQHVIDKRSPVEVAKIRFSAVGRRLSALASWSDERFSGQAGINPGGSAENGAVQRRPTFRMRRFLRIDRTVTHEEAQSAFQTSILVSALRCTLAYVVLPFVKTPLIGGGRIGRRTAWRCVSLVALVSIVQRAPVLWL